MTAAQFRTLAVLAFGASAAWAQTITGSITGTIKDPTNLAVSGARVALVQVTTGVGLEATTSELGSFYFGSLAPGEYSISVEYTGFKKYEKTGIVLSASESLSIGDIRLEVGAPTETITVQAEGTVVQTASSERSGVLTNSQLDGLLIRGRNVTSLLELLPGVVDVQGARENLARNWTIHVQGNRRGTNNLTLDGVSMATVGIQANSPVSISQDAVAEVKVLLSNYQAEHGRLSGANIVVVTKSGTREFHGLGSYFKRHEQFNANGFFNNRAGQAKPRYRYNTWNYNIGGPVYIPGKFNSNRDKLFFFWSQEFWPIRTPGNRGEITVPTDLERNGDFSSTLDLNGRLITVKDPLTGQPFPGNRMPVSRIDRNGQVLLNAFPQPNFLDRSISAGRYNYIFQNVSEEPQRTSTLKIDLPINASNPISFSLTRASDEFHGPLAGRNAWRQLDVNESDVGTALALRYTRIATPTLINEINVGYNWQTNLQEPSSAEELARNQRAHVNFTLGQLYPTANGLDLIPNASFGGITGAAALNIEGRTFNSGLKTYVSIADTVTKIHGTHTFKAGFLVDWMHKNSRNRATFNGAFDFGRNANNPLDSGYAYANALLGVFSGYSESSNHPYARQRASSLGWFVQDTWKATPRLTLDIGLRFSYLKAPWDRFNRLAAFDPSLYNPSLSTRLILPGRSGNKRVGIHPITGEIYPEVLIGAFAPGIGEPTNGVVVAGTNGVPRGIMEDPGLALDPRFGFAYDPFGDGKTAIRGGFGIFHNRHDSPNVSAVMSPLVDNTNIYYGSFADLASASQYRFPEAADGINRAGGVPMTMSFSLGVQQNVGWGTVVDVGYSGTLGRHLMWVRNLNAIPYGTNFDPANADPSNPSVPLTAPFLRPIAGFNDISFQEYASSSNYHSLQVSATRRYTRNLQLGAAWTWSKSMDYGSADGEKISTFVPVRVWNYGLSSYDRTHVLKLNWVYDTPATPFRNAVLKTAFNNWQVSGVASFVSGPPATVSFTTVKATDLSGSPTEAVRVVVTDNPVLPKGERTFSRFFRTDVFRLPAAGTIGNAARSILRGPGINNWDIAVFKTFPVQERARLQFRCEMYNAFNHAQFQNFDTTARFDDAGNQVNARFGEMRSTRNARIIQLALRLYF